MDPSAPTARQLTHYAQVLVRIGLNLQRGQKLLITDPYEAHGVPAEAAGLVEAIGAAADDAGGAGVEVIPAEPARLLTLLATNDEAGFGAFVAAETRRMERFIARGDALLFLTGGILPPVDASPEILAAFRATAWRKTGPAIQKLVTGATNWTVAPLPTAAWAAAVHRHKPAGEQLPSLWADVGGACRIESGGDPFTAWSSHLDGLEQARTELNKRRLRRVRFRGNGTDLLMQLPAGHRWCSAAMTTRGGLPFVANLPTEEVFTLPHKRAAEGRVRVSRPVCYGGTLIEEIELEFLQGRVVRARAAHGEALLHHLLATDAGASRLGEVAIIPALLRGDTAPWQRATACYRHVLLDENARHHIALGESYGFTLPSWFPFARNRSLIHVDLPLDAEAILDV